MTPSTLALFSWYFLIIHTLILIFFFWVSVYHAFFVDAVLPDFGQVYSFIGSVFDPNVSGHLQKLRKMDQIDVETVCYKFNLYYFGRCCIIKNIIFSDHIINSLIAIIAS